MRRSLFVSLEGSYWMTSVAKSLGLGAVMVLLSACGAKNNSGGSENAFTPSGAVRELRDVLRAVLLHVPRHQESAPIFAAGTTAAAGRYELSTSSGAFGGELRRDEHVYRRLLHGQLHGGSTATTEVTPMAGPRQRLTLAAPLRSGSSGGFHLDGQHRRR